MKPDCRSDSKPSCGCTGNSFFHGVKFSVQTISRGRVAYRIWCVLSFSDAFRAVENDGLNVYFGRTVFVWSMKLSEAQNRPDKTPHNSFHWSSISLTVRCVESNQAHSSAPGAASTTGYPQFSYRHNPFDRLTCSSFKLYFWKISAKGRATKCVWWTENTINVSEIFHRRVEILTAFVVLY